MPTEGGRVERRQPIRGGATAPHPPEPENLPCPRCDSTNTKFCYYNNYNLSQPRYFCKGCRRYWTRGGTLRNVPVGGGSRKTSKRSRFSSSTSSAATASTTPLQPPHPIPAVPINTMPSSSESDVMIKAEIPYYLNLNEGSFTSLLMANAAALQGDGFLSNELGHGYGSSAPDQSYVSGNDAGGNDGHAWHLGGFDGGEGGGGALPVNVVDGGDNYFAWSDLAISTPRRALE